MTNRCLPNLSLYEYTAYNSAPLTARSSGRNTLYPRTPEARLKTALPVWGNMWGISGK